MNRDRFSGNTSKIIRNAYEYAVKLDTGYVGSEHILYCIAGAGKSAAKTALYKAGVDAAMIDDLIKRYSKTPGEGSVLTITLTPEADRVMELAEAQADKLHHEMVEPEHILLGMLQEKGCAAAKLILSTGAEPDAMVTDLLKTMGEIWPQAHRTGNNKNIMTRMCFALLNFSVPRQKTRRS